jgi:hypothetical protein
MIVGCLVALFANAANAAPVIFTYAGFLQSDLSDGTNHFGLGNTISAGNAFSLSVTFDTAVGHVSGAPTVGGAARDYVSQCCLEASSPSLSGFFQAIPPGPSPISTIDIILNGNLLSVNGNMFAEQFTHIMHYTAGHGGTSWLDNNVYFNGSDGLGSHFDLAIIHSLTYNGSPFFNPPTTIENLSGSLSLLLLGSDGSTLVDLAGTNVFGLNAPIDTPLPAALPLLAMGLGGLGAMSKRKRCAVRP